jgi:regulator of nucleoside diphosphate kinase
MSELELAERKLASTDASLLRRLGVTHRLPALDELLDEVLIVPAGELPADVVRLHVQVEIQDLAVRRRQPLVLCTPAEAVPAAGCISVLSPIGLGLIGLPVGAIARWRTPGGEACAAEIVSVAPRT